MDTLTLNDINIILSKMTKQICDNLSNQSSAYDSMTLIMQTSKLIYDKKKKIKHDCEHCSSRIEKCACLHCEYRNRYCEDCLFLLSGGF